MKRFSPWLFALGLALGAAAVLAANAYAGATHLPSVISVGATASRPLGSQEFGQPVIDWNRFWADALTPDGGVR